MLIQAIMMLVYANGQKHDTRLNWLVALLATLVLAGLVKKLIHYIPTRV